MIRQGVRICRYTVRIIPKCCPEVTGNSVRMLPKYAPIVPNIIIGAKISAGALTTLQNIFAPANPKINRHKLDKNK